MAAEPHDSGALAGSRVGDASIFGDTSDSAEGAFDISGAFKPGFDKGSTGGKGQPVAAPDPPGGRRLQPGASVGSAADASVAAPGVPGV